MSARHCTQSERERLPARPARVLSATRPSRFLRFALRDVFAFVRRAFNDFGAVVSRIDIVRTIDRGESYRTLPVVRSGGVIPLRISGRPKVGCVLQAVDAVETLRTDPANDLQHAHNCLGTGEPLLRRGLAP